MGAFEKAVPTSTAHGSIDGHGKHALSVHRLFNLGLSQVDRSGQHVALQANFDAPRWAYGVYPGAVLKGRAGGLIRPTTRFEAGGRALSSPLRPDAGPTSA